MAHFVSWFLPPEAKRVDGCSPPAGFHRLQNEQIHRALTCTTLLAVRLRGSNHAEAAHFRQHDGRGFSPTISHVHMRTYLVQVQRLRLPWAHHVVHGEGKESDLSQLARLSLLPFSHAVQL